VKAVNSREPNTWVEETRAGCPRGVLRALTGVHVSQCFQHVSLQARLSIILQCARAVLLRFARIAQTLLRWLRLGGDTRSGRKGIVGLAAVNAPDGSHHDRLESRRRVLNQILESLSPDERLICMWTALGFSKDQIAEVSGRSIESVQAILTRTKQRITKDLRLAMPTRTD
jgi:DNA-directed RNA polymerase specialized sigma24 family protein